MRALFTLIVWCAFAVSAPAQEPSSQAPAPKSQDSTPQPQDTDPRIDASKLGVSLDKIQKGLRTAAAKDQSSGDAFRLKFEVQVFAPLPKIDVLKGIDLVNGAVPGSAPSHREMIEHWTPPIYRSPGLPVSALAMWAAQHFWEKSKKTRCEEEIANYRALLMQGVNVSAPTCTQ